MNKNLLLVIGLVVAGAVGAFFFFNKPGTMMAPGGRETVSSSLVDLVRLGRNYSCTFTSVDDAQAETTGTVYIADQGRKVSGEFVSQVDGVDTTMYLINDGEYAYFWSDTEEEGYKTKIDTESESVFGGAQDSEAEDSNFNETEPVDFECQPWTPIASAFIPPVNVEFIDLSAQMELMQEYMEYPTPAQTQGEDNADGQYCAACGQLEGAAKTQCLAAMGC